MRVWFLVPYIMFATLGFIQLMDDYTEKSVEILQVDQPVFIQLALMFAPFALVSSFIVASLILVQRTLVVDDWMVRLASKFSRKSALREGGEE